MGVQDFIDAIAVMVQYDGGVVGPGENMGAGPGRVEGVGNHQPTIELVVQGPPRKLTGPCIDVTGVGPCVINTVQGLVDTQLGLESIRCGGKRQRLGVVLQGAGHLVRTEGMVNQQRLDTLDGQRRVEFMQLAKQW